MPLLWRYRGIIIMIKPQRVSIWCRDLIPLTVTWPHTLHTPHTPRRLRSTILTLITLVKLSLWSFALLHGAPSSTRNIHHSNHIIYSWQGYSGLRSSCAMSPRHTQLAWKNHKFSSRARLFYNMLYSHSQWLAGVGIIIILYSPALCYLNRTATAVFEDTSLSHDYL